MEFDITNIVIVNVNERLCYRGSYNIYITNCYNPGSNRVMNTSRKRNRKNIRLIQHTAIFPIRKGIRGIQSES